MKLKKPTPDQEPIQKVLYDALRTFLNASRALMVILQKNHVISAEELKETGRKLVDVKHIVTDVLNRTAKVQPLKESSELMQMDDVQLATKFESQDQDISHLVAIASVLLDKLRQKQHITDKEHDTLMRYWLSLPEQHQRLVDRWETARTT